MTILDRIRAHGGDVTRDRWSIRLRPGRMTPAAIAWVRAHKLDVLREVWPEADAFDERAAIREYCGGQDRDEAEADAYREVMSC